MIEDCTCSPFFTFGKTKPTFYYFPFAKSSDEVKIKNTTVRTYSRAVKAFLNYCNLELDRVVAILRTYGCFLVIMTIP